MAGAAQPLRVLAFGDSLVAGFGLDPSEDFRAQLERALQAKGVDATVVNGGVAGDTSAGGLARLDWALADDPDLVIVELGANDGLRGLDPQVTAANIDAIVARLRADGRGVLLAGMRAPPNFGAEYVTAFDGLFAGIAARRAVPLYPFFLDGVVADPALNQPDGIHPNAAGVAVIVERLLPHLLQAIDALDPAARGAS
ncbi:MAG: arylesterase [Dongiaceae bacterium]